jgi:hypothetical protein
MYWFASNGLALIFSRLTLALTLTLNLTLCQESHSHSFFTVS